MSIAPKRIKVKSSRRDAYLKRTYGISLVDYEAMSQRQLGKCAICDEIPKGILVVEHCHKTHKLRLLTCSSCNLALGHFKENPRSMLRAIDYLKRFWNEYYDKVELADKHYDDLLY